MPHRVSCTVDPRVPVWALSPYAGAHRQLVISMKERGRRDACAYVGAAVRAAVDFLAARGELPFAVDLTLVRPVPPSPVVLVDAVGTTGATVEATCAVLFSAGVEVSGVLAVCAA